MSSPTIVRMYSKTESQVALASREGEGEKGDMGRKKQVRDYLEYMVTNITLQVPWWNDRTRMEKMCSVLAVFLVFLSVALCVGLVLVVRGEMLRVSHNQGVKA